MDLSFEISKNANRVILSHHLTETIATVFPENVVQVKAQSQKKKKIVKSHMEMLLSDRDGFFLESRRRGTEGARGGFCGRYERAD